MKDKVLRVLSIAITLLLLLNLSLQTNVTISKYIVILIASLVLFGVIYLFIYTFYKNKMKFDIYILFRPVFGIVIWRFSKHFNELSEYMKYSLFWYSIFLFSFVFVLIRYLFDLIKKGGSKF